MAVFTDITLPKYRNKLQEIEAAYGLVIASIEGIADGSSDSLFKIYTKGKGSPLVLTIYETPDLTPSGLTAGEAGRILRFTDYMADATAQLRDSHGRLGKLAILKPLRTKGQQTGDSPYLEIDLDGVEKCIAIVPFVEGKSYSNSPEEKISPEESFEVGKAVGTFGLIAEKYPRAQHLPQFDFKPHVQKAAEVAEDWVAVERLGYVLSGGQMAGETAARLAADYLANMVARGHRLLEEWEELCHARQVFAETVIHGDIFVDNVLFANDGRLVLLDFNETRRGPAGIDIGVALSSWASRNGQVVKLNTLRFLEGYDRIVPLTNKQLSLIPTYVQLGAFRWESFRVRRFTRHDPRLTSLRSPEEFRLIQEGWEALKPVFSGIQSLEELRSKVSGT